VPPRDMTGQTVLSFKKFSTIVAGLRIRRQVALYVSDNVVFPLRNFTTNIALEYLFIIIYNFRI